MIFLKNRFIVFIAETDFNLEDLMKLKSKLKRKLVDDFGTEVFQQNFPLQIRQA